MKQAHPHKLYRPLFLKAAGLVWRHKILLLPGLLVSMLINFGLYELILGDAERLLPKFNWNFLLPIISLEGLLAKISALSLSRTMIIFVILGLIVFGLLFLAAWAFGTIIAFVKKINKSQKTTLLDALKQTADVIWPILLIALLAKAITYISLNIISLPTVRLVSEASLTNYALYYLAFVLFVALSLLVNIIMYYAILFIAIEKQSILFAVLNAFRLFKAHWVATLEFALLLFLINILAIVAFGIFLSLLSLPLIIFLLVAALAKSNLILLSSVILFGVMVMLSLVLATASLVAFYITSWTLLFLQLEQGFQSKLHRLFHPFASLHRKLFSR